MSPHPAAAQQYINLPGTQPGELDNATPLDTAAPCGTSCHFDRDPTMPQNPMPYDGWLGSMMGNAMRDPLFLAALTVAEQDVPGVGDYCLRCHTPSGFLAGRTRSTPTASRGTELEPGDLDGVSCDVCHRMEATTNVGSAQYVISPGDTRYGPYANIDSIRHPGAVSTWLPDSRMCGTCHSILNPARPLLRVDGTDTGQRFPLDTSYDEWANSAFAVTGSPDARTCQDCHMPRRGRPGFVSTNNTAMMREDPRSHDLAGANSWMLRVLRDMRNDMGSGEFYDPELAPFYEVGAQRAEAMLRDSLTLEVREAPTRANPGDSVQLVARITNRSGHRLPTGYADGRRVWLEVALVDATGRATVISGAYDDAEAHLDTADTQLHIYEAHHGRSGMGHGEHIALHDTIFKDTRIPPRGYRPAPGHEPVGADYSGGEAGALRHWDDARYTIAIPPGAQGQFTLRVRARYQSTTREYVEFLARENRTDDRGMELLRRYNASGRAAPFTMAEATAPLQVGDAVTPSDAGAPSDASAPTDTGVPADTGPGRIEPNCGCATQSPSSSKGAAWALLLAALASLSPRRRRAPR
ncbi:MAG: MYXO-CTERM sorting domain-containing protein [Polyangiales bacterium]